MFTKIRSKAKMKLAQAQFYLAMAKAALDSGVIELKVRQALADKSKPLKYRVLAAKLLYPLFDERTFQTKSSKAELFRLIDEDPFFAQEYLENPFKIGEGK